MRHQDLTLNHRLESWVYADAPTRVAALGFVAGDVGRIAFQTDTGQYWRLIDDTPVVWQPMSSTATLQTAYVSPNVAVGAVSVMAGLAAVITPVASGKLFVTIAGYISNTSTGAAQTAIRYGTGVAPANGAALVGTQVGAVAQRDGGLPVGTKVPFSVSAVITGLAVTPPNPVWLDLAVVSTLGNTSIGNVAVSAYELP